MSIQQPKNALVAEGVKDIPVQSEGYILNHTMLRIIRTAPKIRRILAIMMAIVNHEALVISVLAYQV